MELWRTYIACPECNEQFQFVSTIYPPQVIICTGCERWFTFKRIGPDGQAYWQLRGYA